MNFIKNYEIGNIRVDVPQKDFIYELPLLSFSDARDSLAISLIYQSKMTDNPFQMANGFKLNLHKRLIMANGVPQSYEDGNGNVVKLNRFGDKYAFDDGSYRFIRLVDGNFVLENPDYSKEHFGADGRILMTKDKYGNLILSYFYSSLGKLVEVSIKGTKFINLIYSGASVCAIEYTYDDGNEDTSNTVVIDLVYSDTGITVKHYSGVDYHITKTAMGLDAYSANAGGAFSSTFSQRATAVKNGTAIVTQKFLGVKKVDSTVYDFSGFDDESKVDVLDITNFQGVKTRMQFTKGKPSYSYELFEPIENMFVSRECEMQDHTEEISCYPSRVTFYNNGESSGSQGYNDGFLMHCSTNTHNRDFNRFYALKAFSGVITITGWLKLKETADFTECEILVQDSDVSLQVLNMPR